MEFRQLRYFVAVAEEGNIGRAAERLHVSQPPVSRQIQALEQEVGAALLLRTPKGVELTDAGRIFHAEAQKVLAQANGAVERARAAGRGELGRLDVAFFGSTVYSAVPEALRAFRRAHPGIEVSLSRMGKAEQVAAIREGRVHVGFGRFYGHVEGVAVETLGEEALHGAVPRDLPVPDEGRASLAWLARLPVVLYPAGDRPSFADEIVSILRAAGASFTVDATADDATSALAQVACGGRFTIVPEAIARLDFPAIRFLPLSDARRTVPISCVFAARDRPPVLEAFLTSLRGLALR